MHATGPRTEEGKSASSRNAVKHGLLSESPVVTCLETAQEWQGHLESVLADLAPRGQMETCLAERAGLLLWRMRRLANAEVEWIDLAQAGAEKEWQERAGSPPYHESGTGYEDRLAFVEDCRELYAFACGLPSASDDTVLPGALVAAYLYTLPEVISLPVIQARAAAGLDVLKDPEELEWTAASLRIHLAGVAERIGIRLEELEKALLQRVRGKFAYSATDAHRARDLMKNVRASRLLPTTRQLETLARYEAHLGRELSRTMRALRELQSRPSVHGQSEISNHHSPISDRHAGVQRTLNGSFPFVATESPLQDTTAPAEIHLAGVNGSAGWPETENYETNPPSEATSVTSLLQHSATLADSLQPVGSDERLSAPISENCQSNSPSALTPDELDASFYPPTLPAEQLEGPNPAQLAAIGNERSRIYVENKRRYDESLHAARMESA